jgi:hypothetical protein
MELAIQIFLAAMGVSVISMAVTMSELFKPFRGFVASKNKWAGQLVSCPYCFSHWVSAAVVLVLGLHLPFWSHEVSTVALIFALIVLSAPFSWVLFASYSVMGVE